jgi:ribosome-associated translation inhibitor RaiA
VIHARHKGKHHACRICMDPLVIPASRRRQSRTIPRHREESLVQRAPELSHRVCRAELDWREACITARSKARFAMTPIPLQITFDGLAHSNPIEAAIRERVAWLEQFYPRMTGCRVLVKVPHRHHHAGRDFHVVVDISVPGSAPIVVSHHASPLDGAPDFAAAIHQAFDAIRRQLQDFACEQRVQS